MVRRCNSVVASTGARCNSSNGERAVAASQVVRRESHIFQTKNSLRVQHNRTKAILRLKENSKMARARTLSPAKEAKLVDQYFANTKTVAELAAQYEITPQTVYNVVKRAGYEISRKG